ncbi:DNA repair-scaffolding protein isoform X1 [Ochotona princeps]|uniref:DNA repair-scaffolding protein isoform X1 n=1 Tax=Ochotona princeps TaxID=9978 RepID=UPI0027145461|nr:DNA repair-scaffolding protein isoform X1 [Ochotona princeps]
MPRGVRAGGLKRKRNWAIQYLSFPDEGPLQSRGAGVRAAGGVAATVSESWRRCGEGFQDTAGTPSLTAEKKIITEKYLELSPHLEEAPATSKSTSGLTDITWSSSGSDLSEEDKIISESQSDNGHGSGTYRLCGRNTLCPEDQTSEDEFIDWERDSDREDAGECNDFVDGKGTVDISDSASSASSPSSTSDDRLAELPKQSSAEILEYSSDSGKEDELENTLSIDAESPHKQQLDLGSAKSPAPVLSTPQRQTAKFFKTSENSARKKFLRGGLAERLNGLQNRERSTISLWRHQHVPYQRTLSGGQSSVLIVKILELHEECTIQVALCQQLGGPPTASPSQGVASGPGANLKVLFTKETAGYLRGRPQDIIHIFPPWQKLTVPNGSCPIILNTYFCQKVVPKEDSEKVQEMHCLDTVPPRRNITLVQMYKIRNLTSNSPEIQVMCSDVDPLGTGWTHGYKEAKQHLTFCASSRDSLLDMVESQGTSLSSGMPVRVVVQRVYALHGRDSTWTQQGSSSGHTDLAGARVCLLVQDAYGMFGEVHLDGTLLKDRQLEGKSCSLAGMKVLQKTTRARTAGLFSLIDSLWPPAMPLKAPGHGQPYEEQVKTHLPPPTFCYILTGHPNLGQIDVIKDDSLSRLYQPPVPHCLREILQTNNLGSRCTFYARVIYQRPQLKSLLLLEQREIWLLVTDITLQATDERDPHVPKTLPVCVAPSCVLGPEVLEALTAAAPPNLLFRDALQDQGRIVCVERTVLQLQQPLLCVASGAASCELSGPVVLDELDGLTPVNSICSVQGTVTAVDESTAFSWPVCDRCGNGRLEQRPENGGTLSCGDCSRVVTSPVLRMHLQVFLDCPSRPQCRVKVKLLQSSISSLLSSATCEDGSYEVKSVLGRELRLASCFVQSITAHPASCVGLEEIELRSAGGTWAEPPPLPQAL